MLASTYDTYDYITTHNGSPMPGYKGGAEFLNDGRDGSPVLPQQYAPFKEYDIHPKLPGIDREAKESLLEPIALNPFGIPRIIIEHLFHSIQERGES